VDTSSADFKENARQMDEMVEKLKELRSAISQGGTAKAREKHIQRGKMLPREYV
jgi:3-methylcrotonyl-CoA carboxylase beta subunit